MKAVEINAYGTVNVLKLNENVPVPDIAPNEVLIHNRASSVNPIDTLKRTGYGRSIFVKKRRREFPWILGNDAAGVVTKTGRRVTKFKVNDEVFGAVSGYKQGTYAEYVPVPEDAAAIKPDNLSFEEAAAIPYVAVTTWAALVDRGGQTPEGGKGQKALVHAGSGGVGSFAIQLLKAWGWYVATTCSTGNVDLVKNLGADEVVDYTREDFAKTLKNYNLVYDTIGFKVPGYEERSISVLKPNAGSVYVSIVHPVIKTLDDNGLALGGLKVLASLIRRKIKFRGVGYHWSVVKPSGKALELIKQYIEDGKIKPVIDRSYAIEQIAEAHQYIETGHARGKVAICV